MRGGTLWPLVAAAMLVGVVGMGRAGLQEPPVTAELRRLLEQDQNEPYPANVPDDSAARVAFFTAEWNKHFKPRHDRVADIIRRGLLRTAEDYFIAGMIYNHGLKAEDNLLAHALLTVAAVKGHPD